MESYATEKWKKGFFLKEEDIIKLKNIIETRIKERGIETQCIKLTVYRDDNYKYETIDTNCITSEENASRNKLARLTFSIENDSLKLNLDFDKNENVTLNIESKDKDLTYLLLSDIKQYINTEVCVLNKWKIKRMDLFTMVMPFMMIFFVIFPAFIFKNTLNISNTSELLKSNDINLKLNYLIERQKINYDISELFLPITIMGILIILIIFIPFIKNRLFPNYLFYIGKEKTRYDALLRRRSQLFWGVVVASIIGIITGLLVNNIKI